MTNIKLRQRILSEAARLIYRRQETSCHRAKIKAARNICRGWVKPVDLPTDREIHAEVQRFSQPSRSLSDSHLVKEHDTDLQPEQIDGDTDGLLLDREIDSGLIESEVATLNDLVELEYDDERFELYRALLLPLEDVRQRRKSHPEGDALYHSLQVFVLISDAVPYDEDLLLAALLHDVGKGIDPYHPIEACLEALKGFISDRTGWLIEHLGVAHAIHTNSIGARAHRRLRHADDYDELLLLARCDREGRVSGAEVPELDEALESIRSVASMYD